MHSYHDLASRALAAHRHAHPLIFFAFFFFVHYANIQELRPKRWLGKPHRCRGCLTRVVEHNSGAVVLAHVAAVQPPGYIRFLSTQRFCSRGSDQQPETETRASEAEHVRTAATERSDICPFRGYFDRHWPYSCREVHHKTDVPCPHC